MYCDFYQMTERPFNVTPDPKCLYLNARYREALAALQYGIVQRKGFITLIGEAGTGKTTLLKRLMDDFDQKTRTVFIFNTHVTFEDILEYVFAEFDLPVHNGKKLYMLQRLNTFLLEQLRSGGNVALLIDEAQDLDYTVLEDLRLLSNLETAKEKILQIVLSGQPELGDKLSNPALRQLRQRIAVSCRLLPLSREELSEYVQYRLHAVGCSDLKLFTRDAEEQIYRFSHGIPRLINVVCDNALVIGYALGKRRIAGDVISEAAADLMPLQETVVPAEAPRREGPATVAVPVMTAERPRARVGLIALVLGAILIGLLSVGRSMLQRPAAEQPQEPAAVLARPAEVIRPGSLQVPREAEPVRADPPRGEAAAPPPVMRPQEVPPPADPAPALGPRSDAEIAPMPSERLAGAKAPAAVVEHNGSGSGAANVVEPMAYAAEPAPHVVEPVKRVAEPVAHTAEPAVRVAEPAVKIAEPATPKAPVAVASAPKPAPADPKSLWADAEDGVPVAPEPRAMVTTTDESTDAGTATVPAEEVRSAANQFERVVVLSGDSISRIAMRKYGQSNQTILDLLKLANPELHDVNVISVGQTLQLPDLSESSVVTYGDRRFAVLVYTTSQPTRAAALDAALRARGQHSRVVKGALSARHPVFRVMIDGFADRAAAASASRDVQRLFREDSRMAMLVH